MSRNQPTYDFLAGDTAGNTPQRPGTSRAFRQSLSTNNNLKSSVLGATTSGTSDNAATDALRAEIKALQYELSTIKSERELTSLRHEKELRDARAKAEADFQRAEQAAGSSNVATAKYDSLVKELKETQDIATNEKLDLERKLRSTQAEVTSLQEELEEARSDLASAERGQSYKIAEVESRYKSLQATFEEAQNDLDSKVSEAQLSAQKLSSSESRVADLEAEIARLRATAGDQEAVAVMKREFSGQVSQIKNLENQNRELASQNQALRTRNEAVRVIEEEKRDLESRVRMMDDLRREMAEGSLQKQILEEERDAWTTYLQNEDADLEFSSPADLARAFLTERLEKASLAEKLGQVSPELREKDGIIQGLEDAKAALTAELTKIRGSSGNDSRIRTRLERHRMLAVKEAELLRKQLKMFETEETSIQPGSFDEANVKRIEELEGLLDEHRAEIQSLSEELSAVQPTAQPNSLKRTLDESDPSATTGADSQAAAEQEERIGSLIRKNRSLQDSLSKAQQSVSLLSKEMEIMKQKNESLISSRHRILQLRENPTSTFEKEKLSKIESLREENAALLAQLQSTGKGKTIPASTLENLRVKYAELETTIAERDKRLLRLRQIFTSKSSEFREAVFSILGWKIDFQQNGRVRVTSMYYPSPASGEGDDGEQEQNSIVFDGEQGTMKIADSSEDGRFKAEVEPLVRFWTESSSSGAVPCLLAQLTLEFYEKYSKNAP